MPFCRDHDLELQRLARDLRRNASEAERRMWWILRCKNIAGCRFRRQVPIAGFIVDFCCLSAKLIVEVDGKQHGTTEARAYDEQRTAVLRRLGFHVIRFWAVDVMKDHEAIGRTTLRVLNELKAGVQQPY